MKGKQTALMPGNGDKVGFWLTPKPLMSELQAEFDFDFDACPYPRPAGFDGLKESWGKRTWVNPPFRGPKMPWVRRAIAERKAGNLVVMILPTGNPGHAFHALAEEPDLEIRLLNVEWCDPEGNASIPNPALLFILRPRKTVPLARTGGEGHV